MSSWKTAYASIAGKYHIKHNIPCQDFCICQKIGDVLVAVLSDGAGSAAYGGLGAKIACFSMYESIKEFLQGGNVIKALKVDVVRDFIRQFQVEVSRHAIYFGEPVRNFACTILGCAVGENEAVFFQIGDGAMVIHEKEKPGQFKVVFWPQSGQYANMTNFATEGERALTILDYAYIQSQIDQVAVFSDGLQRLALHYKTRTAFGPFFKPLFDYIKCSNESANRYLNLLSAFLNRDDVNKRTDDDKTLIAAVKGD